MIKLDQRGKWMTNQIKNEENINPSNHIEETGDVKGKRRLKNGKQKINKK